MAIDRKYKELSKFFKKIKTTYIKGVSPEKFIENLKKEKVNVVVDIRFSCGRPPYFAPINLRILLKKNDIEYIRFQKLGNPKVLRDRAGDDFELAKQLYQNYINNNPESRQELNKLYKLFRFRKNYCLICYCPVTEVELCHRFWLKELLINLKRKNQGFSEMITLQNFTQKLVPEVTR